MEPEKYINGLIVKKHITTRKHDGEPVYKVIMKSLNKKITLNIDLPDLGMQIFQLYPLGEVVEMSLKEPSQFTLDKFGEESEEDEDV